MKFLDFLLREKQYQRGTATVYVLAYNCDDPNKYKSSKNKARELFNEYGAFINGHEYPPQITTAADLLPPTCTNGMGESARDGDSVDESRLVAHTIKRIMRLRTTNQKRIKMIRILLEE
jgi:hypothetical protein